MMTRATSPLQPTLTAADAADRLWDAVVIGSGPAGTVAATLLARQGASVLLVEKSDHPRYKVCGGCLSARALAELANLGLAGSFEGPITSSLRLCTQGKTATIALPPGRSISRSSLDMSLVTAAIAHGASFLDRTLARVESCGTEFCTISLHSCGTETVATTKTVLAADGLNGSSLARLKDFTTNISPRSLVGAGALLPVSASRTIYGVEPGTINMHCAPGGYVGMVRVEHDRLQVAAALSTQSMKAAGSPARAIAEHLRLTGFHCPVNLTEFDFQGTPALTRRRTRLAGRRLLVIGDSSGYVEPFTGEGMLWAIQSAHHAADLALEGISQWHPEFAERWESLQGTSLERNQLTCRWFAAVLRHKRMSQLLVGLAACQPALAARMAEYLFGCRTILDPSTGSQSPEVLR